MISWLAGDSRTERADWPLPAALVDPKPPEPLAAEPLLPAELAAAGSAACPAAGGGPAIAALDPELLALLLEQPASAQPQMTVPAMVPAMSTRPLMFR
jgi:hypothetical protein